MPPPTRDQVLTKAGFELAAIVLLGVLVLVVHLQSPFQRGFYCDDENLLHPYTQDQQFPTSTLGVVWITTALIILIPVELYRNFQVKRPEKLTIHKVPLPWILLDLYRVLGHFLQGALATVLITEVAKVNIGRLRPHFLCLCKPACDSEDVNTFLGTTQDDLEEVYTSLTEDAEDYDGEGVAFKREELLGQMREARFSFMSGHTATSFFTAFFLILYLQVWQYHPINPVPSQSFISFSYVLIPFSKHRLDLMDFQRARGQENTSEYS